ncbi:MAG: flagellar motor switch protein FliM [Verrucomicrobia bacterium]|nr:flagellar motor switch protein FliM [Verrucomicrobiota bacterium]
MPSEASSPNPAPAAPSSAGFPSSASGFAGGMGGAPDLDAVVTVITGRGRNQKHRQGDIQSFDGRHSSILAPSEMRRIRLRHEQFVRALAGRFSIQLRLEFQMKIVRLQTMSYQKLIESYRSPTHLTLFRADPLKGVCLLEVPPGLGLLIVDRLLGGPGRPPANPGELTELEITLLDQIIQNILAEWAAPWRDVQELRPLALGYENTARFLNTSPADASMLVLAVETGVGDFVDYLQIALPCSTFDPIIRKLGALGTAEKEPVSANAKPRWNRQFDDAPIPVIAEWQGLQLTTRELMDLKQGDVLLLSPECAGQVRLKLAKLPKFVGRLGTSGAQWAVQITGAIKP